MNKKITQIAPTNIVQKFLQSQNLDSFAYLGDENQTSRMTFLDKNENPFSPPLGDLDSLQLSKLLKNYPDPNSVPFINQLSKYLGLPTSFLLAGSGSDELLDLIVRTYATSKDSILSVEPSFSMYEFYTKICGAKYESIPLKLNLDEYAGIAQYDLDEELFIEKAKDSKIIILARPNNPDGMSIPINFIKQLLDLRVLVIVDEAYIDFSKKPCIKDLVKTFDNLIVSRSFSKSYSFAGLRLGYVIANPSIIKILNYVKSPYNVNNLALQFGSLLLKKQDDVNQNIEKVIENREIFYKDLCRMRKNITQFYIHPSDANFILLRFQNSKIAESLYRYFLQYNIKIRKFMGALSNCLRISIGTQLEMSKVIKIMKLFFEVK